MQLADNVIKNVTHIMEVQGLTQGELADAGGITRIQLNRILNGHCDATLNTCESIALGIGLPPDALLRAPTQFQKLVQEIFSTSA